MYNALMALSALQDQFKQAVNLQMMSRWSHVKGFAS